MKIKEVIVVEGRSDVVAVKRAVDAEVIVTSGAGINERILNQIEQAANRCGIIVLTDPDFPGERIRAKITKRIPTAKHAFLPRELAEKDGDIGIENASPEAIREALRHTKTEVQGDRSEFQKWDLVSNDLEGHACASYRRNEMGRLLNIGFCNAKQFLSRLNRFGISREEFDAALKLMNEKAGQGC